jgi:Cu+-exporting ATPase
VTGTVDGRRVAVGNAKLLVGMGIVEAGQEARANELRGDGATVMYVAVDDKPAGIIAVADPIKTTTPAALASLRSEGIRIVMLTGDNRTTASAVAAKLGITDVEAEVLPEQKNAIVRRLRSEGHAVAMAGDGVNDAPALAEADVGIAMGTGTDVAMQSAAVTLVKGDLAGIARARVLSRATMRNIRQNLVLAFVYNVLGIPVAAGALYPAFGLLLSPIVAAAAMSLSSVSVIGNSLRLRAVRLWPPLRGRSRRATRHRLDLERCGRRALSSTDARTGPSIPSRRDRPRLSAGRHRAGESRDRGAVLRRRDAPLASSRQGRQARALQQR